MQGVEAMGSKQRATVVLILCVAILAAVLPPSLADAQSRSAEVARVGVGGPELRVDAVSPYEARWAVTIATPDNRLVERGHWVERLEDGACRPRACWRRTLRVLDAAGAETSRTINVFEAATLAPISTEQQSADGSALRLAFQGRRIDGRQETSAFFHIPARQRHIGGRLQRPAFELNNGPTGFYLALMPHAAGVVLALPAVDIDGEDPRRVIDAHYRVRGPQRIVAGGDAYDTILIDALNTYGYWQYWVIAEPPYVVRWLYVGPGGGRTMFTLTPGAHSVQSLLGNSYRSRAEG